jgi:parallel beta-helix repeat protein
MSSSDAARNAMTEKALPPHKSALGGLPLKGIVVAALVIVVVAIAGGSYLLLPHTSTTSTSVSTSTHSTTIGTSISSVTSSVPLSGSSLTGCANITSPGSYVISSKIKTGIAKGACINVLSSNVKISCSSAKVTGSGPFSAVPPFSYGIRIYKASNVSVVNCQVSNFSYGVAAFSSSRIVVSGSNVSSNYMSNIYLNATTNSTIENNYLTRSLSPQGTLYLSNGSVSNLVQNNTVAHNQFYGINVNSTGETFINNKVNGSPSYGFYCSPTDSFSVSSKASGGSCYNNYGCAFLSCSGLNIPTNISKLALSGSVMGCGSIDGPGTYTLGQNIQMKDFLNVSNPLAMNQSLPCIAIKAANVNLNCNGYGIYNSTYPIGVYNVTGVSITNCRIKTASGYGILMLSAPNSSVSNVVISGAALGGILIQNSYFDNVTNSSVTGSGYGVYINNSQSDNLFGVNTSKNVYGLYVVGSSIGNNFFKVTSFNNSDIDVYSAPSLAGSQTQFVSGMSCGYTNAHWAPCRTFQQNLGYFPVTSCTTISTPGTYELQDDIIGARDNCIAIRTSNVVFNCMGKALEVNSGFSSGYGFTVLNVSNVMIEDCNLLDFQGGVYAHGSRSVNVTGVNVSGGSTGIVLNATTNSMVLRDTINGSSAYGIRLTGVNYTDVLYNQLTYGTGGTGISFNGSRFNTALNNTVTQYKYGFSFDRGSYNNTVSNNTASVSAEQDYICAGASTGIDAEEGGINYGASKSRCGWMALVQQVSKAPPCSAVMVPDIFVFDYDYVYPYGGTCFTVFANATTINCNGHTIISTSGGTFVQVGKGTHGTLIENCFLKGFSTAIEVDNGSATLFNNTIAGNSSSNGIIVSGSQSGSILQNNVTAGVFSFFVYNTVGESIQNNSAYSSRTGYYIYNGVSVKMGSDYAGPSTLYGLVLNATPLGQFGSLKLLGRSAGMQCIGSSQNSVTMVDSGGNSCSSELNCTWLSSSSGSC